MARTQRTKPRKADSWLHVEVGPDGSFRVALTPEEQKMGAPVQCTYCGAIYDLAHVTVTARYADCSMYKSPCCNHDADTREFVSLPSFTRLRP